MDGAISPGEMTPVATWYRRGWNRCSVVSEISTNGVPALPSFFAAARAPNPDPTMTTCVRSTENLLLLLAST